MPHILLLGMHRSGTSAISRAIGLLGAETGPEDHLDKHWEHKLLRKQNQFILRQYRSMWDAPPDLQEGWTSTPEIQTRLAESRSIFEEEFGDAPITVWKDPRTCLFVPFWIEVYGADAPVVVLIYRHPFEVAKSLSARSGLVTGHSIALWERHNADALRSSVGLPTVVVEYGSIMADPAERMAALADDLRTLGVDLPNDARTTDLELSSENRHHTAPPGLDDPLVTDSQRALFTMLGDLVGAHKSLELPTPVPEPHPLSLELLQLARMRKRGAAVNPRAAAREAAAADEVEPEPDE